MGDKDKSIFDTLLDELQEDSDNIGSVHTNSVSATQRNIGGFQNMSSEEIEQIMKDRSAFLCRILLYSINRPLSIQ